MRDEFLNGELFGNLYEAEVPAKRWKDYYNHIRPHGSLSKVVWLQDNKLLMVITTEAPELAVKIAENVVRIK